MVKTSSQANSSHYARRLRRRNVFYITRHLCSVVNYQHVNTCFVLLSCSLVKGMVGKKGNNNNNRQFRYGDDESQKFLDDVVGTAPRRQGAQYEQMDTSTNFTPRDGWTSEVYSRLDGGSRRHPNHGCLSCSVLLYSILLSFAGIAVIVVAYLQKKIRLLPLCPNCSDLEVGLYTTGGLITAIGILGIASAVVRMKCLAIPFTIVIIFIGLVFLAGGVVCIVMRANLKDIDLLPLWKSTLQSTPTFICDVEGNLKCSGFSVGCCLTNYTPVDFNVPLANLSYCYINSANGTFLSADTLQVITWPGDVCDLGCVNNNFTTMCDVAIRSEIQSNFIPIVASMIPFGVLSFVVGVFAICMTRKKGAMR